MKRVFLLLSLLPLLAVSCQQKSLSEEYGKISVGVRMPEETRASAAGTILDSADVSIYYADFSGKVRGYRYNELPSEITLCKGQYRVDASAGENCSSAPRRINDEAVSYYGSANVEIEPLLTKTVTVEAKVSSALVKVNFDGSIPANFTPGYSFTISIEGAQYVFDADNLTKTAYVMVEDLTDPVISWKYSGKRMAGKGDVVEKEGTLKDVKGGRLYELDVKYTVKDGTVDFALSVDTGYSTVEDIVVFDTMVTGMRQSENYEIWAAHADVHADVNESAYPDPSKIAFEYSVDGAEWASCPAQRVTAGDYGATLTGLTPSTAYQVRLAVDSAPVGDAISFTTETAPNVPNYSFEETYDAGKYTEFAKSESELWWGSGNGSPSADGSAKYGYEICYPDTGTKVDGNQSACLASAYAVIKFAAGNLFSGYFAGMEGTKGGKVNMGRKFTARPTGFRVWLKYSTGKLDSIDGYPSGEPKPTEDDYDRARVEVALGVWSASSYGGTEECPIQVNTTKSETLINYSKDPCTIAQGAVILQGDDSSSKNKWVQYEVKLNYKKTDVYPKYIVVSCAASMLGDYFTGCTSSKLWMDKFELIYE